MENNNKIIINVGRQIGSGGRAIAKILADKFGCKFYDKELLNLAAQESGFSERFFEQNDEQRGFLKSLFHIHVPLVGDSNLYRNEFSEEGLFLFQSEAIKKAAANGSCVFVGRTADYILRDCPNAISVFVTADIDCRIKRVAQRMNTDEDAARKYIEEHERQRSTYYNYYTGKEWGHASSYDLCIDSSILGIEKTAEYIFGFINGFRQMRNL